MRENAFYSNCFEDEENNIITLQFEGEDLENYKKHDLDILTDALFWFDCYFTGEEYCIGNFNAYIDIYSVRNDMIYIFPLRCLEDLANGKIVVLKGEKNDGSAEF